MSIHLRGLSPNVRAAGETALELARYFQVPVTVTSTYRSLQEQRRLRQLWEAGLSRFPANRAGDSAHNFGWAFDSVTQPSLQRDWNLIREWVGFAVPSNDEIHAEVPNWRRFR